jgi:hypothetical protein
MSEQIRAVASQYLELSLPVVPVAKKTPLIKWQHWQTQKQTTEEFESLPWTHADGFGVICGCQTVDGLFFAAIDFDVKNVRQEAIEKGRNALRYLRTTKRELTPSGGEHWLYLSQIKPRSISAYHNDVALELIGSNKICICYPSAGYLAMNDNSLSTVVNLQGLFFEALSRIGVKTRAPITIEADCNHTFRPYRGKDPPCIQQLDSGTEPGIRNESAIRLAAFWLNRKKLDQKSVWAHLAAWNNRNTQPLETAELNSVFSSAKTRGYRFGCADPFLARLCDRKNCAIAQRRERRFEGAVENL